MPGPRGAASSSASRTSCSPSAIIRSIPAHVSLFRLDAAGKPQGEPATLKLPQPDGLTRLPNQPTGLAFHTTRPLLYVWQDVVLPRTPQNQYAPLLPAEEAALNEIDHLLIYRLEGRQAAPCWSRSVRGIENLALATARPHGSVCVDPTAERLYVPNLRADLKNLKNKGVIAGSYVLDAEGLPVIGKDVPKRRQAAARRPPTTRRRRLQRP